MSDLTPYFAGIAPPDPGSDLPDPAAVISRLRAPEREYQEAIPLLRRRIAIAQIALDAARQGPRDPRVDLVVLHQHLAEARVDLAAARTACRELHAWRRELTAKPVRG